MEFLVVEDDSALARMIARMLQTEGYDSYLCERGDEAARLLKERQYTLIILDWNLPAMSGMEILQEMRAGGDTTPVLMITARDGLTDKVAALDAGADDYIVKPFHFEEFKARIGALQRRIEQKGILEYGDLRMDLTAHQLTRAGVPIELGKVEWQLCAALLEAHERVCYKEVLYQKIWGHTGTSNTLEVHVASLRRKLEADGQSRVIHTVRGFGYVLREGSDELPE